MGKTKVAPIEEDQTEEPSMSLEEEIMGMERWKKELIRKYGGDQYRKKLRGLIKKKQSQIR
jgi:hypothetical protein